MRELTFKEKIDMLNKMIKYITTSSEGKWRFICTTAFYYACKYDELTANLFPELVYAIDNFKKDSESLENKHFEAMTGYSVWSCSERTKRIEFLTNIKLMMIDLKKKGIAYND